MTEDGHPNRSVMPERLIDGIDPGEAERALLWLRDNGLTAKVSLAGDYTLTPAGLNSAEQALEDRADTSESNVVDGDGLHVVVLSREAVAAVEALLTAIDRADIESKLDGEQLASYEADRHTVDVQIKSPTPRKRVIRDGIRNLLRPVRAFGVEVSAKVISNAVNLD